MSLVDSAASGNRLAALESLRDTLARNIEGADAAKDVAALSNQLTQVLKQVEELTKLSAARGSKVDELAERRRNRNKPIRDGRSREA